jgi:hypothetical protein
MNNLFHSINSLKKLRLFAVLVAVTFGMASCTKPESGIGESIQPAEDLLYAYQTDTTTLFARTVAVDSVISDFYSNVMIGNYVDDKFGAVQTTGVLQFIPSTSKPRFNNVIRIDSVVLSLVYQNAVYGKNVPMYFNVNEVTETLDNTKSYYDNSVIATASQNLMKPGMEFLDPNPEAASSTNNVTPALRLHLKHSLGQKILNADTTILDNPTQFKEFFSGLAIRSETMDGQVINYLQNDPATRLTIYYASASDTGEVQNFNDFVVSRSSCKAFTLINRQYNGTALAPLQQGNDAAGNDFCYLQSGGGTRVVIDLKNTKWVKEFEGVTINRAELILPYEKSEKYAPIGSMLVVYKEPGESFFKETQAGGNVNISTGLYRVNITNHLQNYLNGDVISDEIYIQPVYTLAQYANSWSVARSLLRGPQFSGDIKQNMRLVITYSY